MVIYWVCGSVGDPLSSSLVRQGSYLLLLPGEGFVESSNQQKLVSQIGIVQGLMMMAYEDELDHLFD